MKNHWCHARWLPPLALIALLITLQLEPLRGALRFERELIMQGQWWRVLTGNLVHLDGRHLLLNGLGITALVVLVPRPVSPAIWLRRLTCLGLGVGAGLLWLAPAVQWYAGMSGILHGLLILALGRQALADRDAIGYIALALLLGKVTSEAVTGAPVLEKAAIDAPIIVQAHLYGALSAVIYGFVFGSFTREEPQLLTRSSGRRRPFN